ncbi:hypothetical protein BPAE_0138g00040 [Botrytis paeoniae]|uniref:Uncharacterized protein n=1 Tax=Botrytis paeoniae TaxID=278948 RepID=A0A4Z1FNS5_9HELO|nr:hypothetical protein BPAE_0138g00040 [Botrytis paeoniae]
MSSKKSKAIVTTGIDDFNDYDDYFNSDDFEDRLSCSNSNIFRQPVILKPGITEQTVKGNVVTQRWGLPTPCEYKACGNTADVIVSAIEFWKPSALLKLLDLSVSQFYWIEPNRKEFCVERIWRFVRVTLDKQTLFYHIHDGGRWQLLASERLGVEDICDMKHHKENWYECHISKSDRILAGRLGSYLPWHQERLKEFKFECYITTKDGHWIEIDKSEAAGGDATAANKKSAPQQVSLESHSDTEIETTINATVTKKTDQTHLQGTKKRKRVAE